MDKKGFKGWTYKTLRLGILVSSLGIEPVNRLSLRRLQTLNSSRVWRDQALRRKNNRLFRSLRNNLQKDQRLQFPQRSRNIPSKIVVVKIQADEAFQVSKFRWYSSLDVVFVQLPVSIIRQVNPRSLLHKSIS